MSSVDTYRGQQGLTGQVPTSGYNPDPIVVDWIKQAAAATGADPVVLMATALQESGGKLHGPAGDGGTSFSTFQFHIGGALGKHPPSWAATYPAFLNRAQAFAKYHVRGGVGAAAVQGPKDAKLYAQGVDSLMAIAHSILQGSSGAPGSTPLPGTPAVGATGVQRTPGFDFQAKSGPQAALDILKATSPGEALARFNDSQRVFHMPAQAGTPARSGAQPSVAAPSGLLGTPGGGWGGSYSLATALANLGKRDGLSVASEKRARKMTSSGGVSDHWIGSKTAYAYDMSNGSAPTPQMDAYATQVAAALGVPNWHGGVLNVNKGGYRYQILYRTHVGGNHFNHVHVGVKKL